jgi:hypothetical protein
MIQTLEAIVDTSGKVNLLSDIRLKESRRAIVTILDEKPRVSETTLLSEQALAEDWLREEEDEAWDYIQSEK